MADQIQIGDVAPRVRYTADGVTSLFSFPFPIFSEDDLEIYVDDVQQTHTTDYTITDAGNPAGGVVSFLMAPASSAAVILVRRLTIRRSTDFTTSGAFDAGTINAELDFQTAALQQLDDDLTRSLRLSKSEPPAALILPAAGARAERALFFDAAGDASLALVVDASTGLESATVVPLLDSTSGDAGSSPDVCAADHAHPLPSLSDIGIASMAEAQDGAINTKLMTPVRAAQALAVLGTPTDRTARNIAATALAYTMANNDAVVITGNIGSFKLTDIFESDSLAVSTNATYDATDGYYHNTNTVMSPSAAGEWSGATGEYSFPGADIEVTANDNFIYTNDEFSGDFEFSFTYKLDESVISLVGVFEASNKGSVVTSGTAQSFSGWFWNNHGGTNHLTDYENVDVTSTNDFSMSGQVTDGDVVTFGRAGTTIYVKVNGSTIHNFTTTSSAPLSVLIGQALTSAGHFLDVSWAVPGVPTDMTLIPDAFTLPSADPADVFGYFVFDPVDTVTFGTDVIGAISINGGSSYTTGAWSKVGDIGTSGRELFRLDADASTQSGTSLVYRLMTANGKLIHVHSCVGLVALY